MNPRMHHGVILVLVLAGAAPALAWPDRESIVYPSVPSDGVLNSPANALRSPQFVGGYPLGMVRVSGTLTSVHPRTWRTDSRIVATAPGGASVVIQPFLSGSTFTSLPFNTTVVVAPGLDPAGVWSFRFFESFDDGDPGEVDAAWNITIVLTDDPPPPPAATDLGVLLSPGAVALNVPLASGQVRWFKFTLPHPVSGPQQTYLDLDTVGSTLPGAAGSGMYPDDTQIALYGPGGELIAGDDDSGPDFTSQLTFGWGMRPAAGNGLPYNGRHGDLPAGVYYLAVGEHPVAFGSSYWSVVPGGTRMGSISVNIATNLTNSPPGCYANCDGSTIAPVLNVNDFICFQGKYAAGDPSANCDGSTSPPVLNVNDFICFQSKYAAGCP